jgi:hypothetical protein
LLISWVIHGCVLVCCFWGEFIDDDDDGLD